MRLWSQIFSNKAAVPFFFVFTHSPHVQLFCTMCASWRGRCCRHGGPRHRGGHAPVSPQLSQRQPLAPQHPPGTSYWCCSPEPSPGAAGGRPAQHPSVLGSGGCSPRLRHPGKSNKTQLFVSRCPSPLPRDKPWARLDLSWALPLLAQLIKRILGRGDQARPASSRKIQNCDLRPRAARSEARVWSALRETISVVTFLHVGVRLCPRFGFLNVPDGKWVLQTSIICTQRW